MNLPVVVQVHPPHPSDCSQHRCAAGPYKPGRAARLAATAGLDTQDYNQTTAMARGISGTTLRTSIAQARLLPWSPLHTHADGHRPEPSEGLLCECSTHSVGANYAVEAHRDVQRIGNAQAAGANPAIGTRHALQALTAERPSRKREVDRATRSWGTSRGSLTQRDRDPPFKRSDAGAIPARPTNLPGTHRQRCARLVSGGGEVQVLSRAPKKWRAKQAGSCTRLLTDGCRLRHGLRVVRSPPT